MLELSPPIDFRMRWRWPQVLERLFAPLYVHGHLFGNLSPLSLLRLIYHTDLRGTVCAIPLSHGFDLLYLPLPQLVSYLRLSNRRKASNERVREWRSLTAAVN